jgi:hypothetical protein
VLIGLVSLKPQFGMLVPVALAAAGLWRPFIVAGATIAGMALVATALFGWAVWPAWLATMASTGAIVSQHAAVLKLMPTVASNLMLAGVSPGRANAVQGVVAVLVVAGVWLCFRRGTGRLAVAALLVGTFLATPYAFAYDLPAVTAAIALFIQVRVERGGEFGLGEIAVLTLAVLSPALMFAPGIDWPLSGFPLALLACLTARDALAGRDGVCRKSLHKFA